MTALADAHIEQQARLREIVSAAVLAAWTHLPSHDEAQVPAFTATAAGLSLAAQRQSVALTNAFIARSLRRQPVAVAVDEVLAAVRPGVTPQELWRRPFIETWSALANRTPFEEAVKAGGARAASAANTNVQLAMRQTLVSAAAKDPAILGYQRVPDANACAFCKLVAGQRYKTDQLMPIHNHCGCGVDVITADSRHLFTGKPEHDPSVTRDGVTAAVEQHGELGPVLVDGADNFTRL